MNQSLTFAEMHEMYPEMWLLVEDIETDDHLRLIRGIVTCASVNKDDIYAKAKERTSRRVALVCTRTHTDDTVYVL
jgi:hypothetical protein